jgi:hypothetical protein
MSLRTLGFTAMTHDVGTTIGPIKPEGGGFAFIAEANRLSLWYPIWPGHYTIRGAAGGSLLNAEQCKKGKE